MTYMAEERWHDCQLVHYTQLWSLSPATTCISSTSAWVTPITRNILITHKNSSVHFQCRSGTSPYSDNSSMAPVSVWEHCMRGQQCQCQDFNCIATGRMEETKWLSLDYLDFKSHNCTLSEAVNTAQNQPL